MPAGRMVRLTMVGGAGEARVLAARLGAEGILWELRGGVGGPYPLGPVQVYVDEADYDTACEVLALADDAAPAQPGRAPLALWLVLLAIVAVAAVAVARVGLAGGAEPHSPAPTVTTAGP